jgi:hypothetical protein
MIGADEHSRVMLGYAERRWRPAKYARHVSQSFGAYQALGRIVIVPHMTDERGWTLDDTESLSVYALDTADEKLGLLAVKALTRQRHVDYSMDFQSEHYRTWVAANRKRICTAFGVSATKDWLLPDATYVSAEAEGQVVNVLPWRRHGKRNAWVGTRGDPVATASMNEPATIGAVVKNMLAICLPPAR